MKLSRDIIVYDHDNDCHKIYNKFTHKMSIVHKAIFEYLQAEEIRAFPTIHDDLLQSQIDILLENDVLINDDDEYLAREFKNKHVANINSTDFNIKRAYLHLTMDCNLDCKYCYMRDNTNNGNHALPAEKWLNILRKLKDVGVEEVMFTGGEPTLHRELEIILKFANELGFHINLLTNGTNLDSVKDMLQYVQKCIVSIDGKTTSEQRGINQQNLLKNVIKISKKYPDKISVRSVVVNGLEEEVLNLTEELEKLGIRHIRALCLPHSLDELNRIPDYRKYSLVDDTISTAACDAGVTIIAIDEKGNIYPCQTLIKPEFLITNIFEDNWYEEFTKNRLNAEINKFNPYESATCTSCVALHFCSGGCGSVVYSVYKNFNKRPKFLCDYYVQCVEKKIMEVS
ncbi:MAG: radical SAM protein [Turicibacter sp.]|nr:radical SAM protein [Turicibacter sp.]